MLPIDRKSRRVTDDQTSVGEIEHNWSHCKQCVPEVSRHTMMGPCSAAGRISIRPVTRDG